MIIAKDAALKIIATWLAFALLISHLFLLLFPSFFNSLNDQSVDRIQRLLYASPDLRPAYQDMIIHVDLNNSSLKSLKNHHPDRTDHALLIRNLSAMDTALQMLDFVYAGTTSETADMELYRAVREAGTVVAGMALRITAPAAVTSGFHEQRELPAPRGAPSGNGIGWGEPLPRLFRSASAV